MGRPLRILIPHASRSFRYRFIFILCFLALFQQQRLFFLYRDALSAKYSSTRFPSNVEELRPRLSRPDDEDAQFQDELLANRDDWEPLGSGWEGKTYIYNDSVIKTFTPSRSPFRNCAPGQANEKWPTEIPASLYFGGSFPPTVIQPLNSTDGGNSTFGGFLPVKAYFMAAPSPKTAAEWHLVTPLLREGNLVSLSKHILERDGLRDTRDVDASHRPAFNGLLRALDGMHSVGYCHDDVKGSNIFVEGASHWVLGDLGNVRETSHPYHYSRIWKDNGQLQDCRANDAIRALKSYLDFLRAASGNADAFNMELVEGKEPWSRWFWWTMADSFTMSAAELRVRSLIESPWQVSREDAGTRGYRSAYSSSISSCFMGSKKVASVTANAILRASLSETRARWATLAWFFGVPISNQCGYDDAAYE